MHSRFFHSSVIVFFMILLPSLCAGGGYHYGKNGVTVDIVTPDRGMLHQYPVYTDEPGVVRRYVMARENEPYSIRVRNRTNDRIGLVIAVDGRNILSGKKSYLKSGERMYVLGPHARQKYDGWRTGANRTNAFYFTAMDDSYAADRGDFSAMGVIAVAVYRERVPMIRRRESDSPFYPTRDMGRKSPVRKGRANSPIDASIGEKSNAVLGSVSATMKSSAKRSETAGTGFGESRHSPSVTVQFTPERTPLKKVFIKYEWRSTLCKRGIIRCDEPEETNRFWPGTDNDGYVPFPSGYRR